ncbi:Hypothetical protein PBC10988_3050 [Planctomycetales bacterium 10988]|nr:Hypothetical protein PBC10988_3050 [Planctomycetales bacterium 10988]
MPRNALSISKAGRHNLNAICQEFERCSRNYLPLFHQRMVPWSELGQVGITPSQWQAFRRTEDERLSDDVWWQWDEPHSGNEHLGQWFGDPDGMEEFSDLSESVAMVLSREAIDFDPLDFDVEISGGTGWIALLHDWAFKYQMPLLRSEMSLWGVESYELEEFYDLAEHWDTSDDDTKFPRHPVVWRLIDNVFTASMTALRALLKPDVVIATNEPWPITMGLAETSAAIDGDGVVGEKPLQESKANCHRMNFDRLHWRIIPADERDVILLPNEVGVRHIALLLGSPDERFTPMVMVRNNGVRPTQIRAICDKLSSHEIADAASDLSVRDSLDWDEAVIDRECDDELRAEYKRLEDSLEDARELGNVKEVERLRPGFQALMKQFRMDHDRSGRIRLFQKSHWERSRKNVGNAINRAIESIRKRSSALAEQVDAQIDRQSGFTYRPIDALPSWTVSRTD